MRIRLFVTGVLLAAFAAAAPGQTPTVKASPYQRLDAVRLAQSLGMLRMTELLKALQEELSQSPAPADRLAAAVATAQLRIVQAQDLVGDDQTARRHALLDEAVDTLRKAVAERPDDNASLEVWLAYLRTRFVLAKTLGIDRAYDHAENLFNLTGSVEDRRALERITADAVEQLVELENTILDMLELWRDWRREGGSLADLAVKVPAVEKLQRELKFDSARIRLYRGVAIQSEAVVEAAVNAVGKAQAAPDRAQKVSLLEEAVALLGAPAPPPEGGRPLRSVQRACNTIRRLLGDLRRDTPAQDLVRQFEWASRAVQAINRERTDVLTRCIKQVEYLAQTPPNIWKYQALLIQGMAAREMSDYEKAESLLGQVRSAALGEGGAALVPPTILRDALYHLARARIEGGAGDMAKARESIDEFVEVGLEAARGDPPLEARLEVDGALLRIHLYDTLAERARAEGRNDEARRHELDAAVAMFAFEDQRDDLLKQIEQRKAQGGAYADLDARQQRCEFLQNHLFRLMVQKYAPRLEQKDVDPLLRAVIQVAKAAREAGRAETREQREQVIEALRSVVQMPVPTTGPAGTDAVVARVFATARWHLGHTLFSLRQPPDEALLAKAEKLAEQVRLLEKDNKDASAAKAQLTPVTGQIQQQREPTWQHLRAAAENWMVLAGKYPDHPLAFAAVQNAVVALNEVFREQGRVGIRWSEEFLKQYRDGLAVLTDRYPEREGVDRWFPELATVNQLLATETEGVAGLRNKLGAIRGFEKTSKDRPAVYANNMLQALKERLELFNKSEDWRAVVESIEDDALKYELRGQLGKLTDEAKLIEDLSTYAAFCRELMGKTQDAELKSSLPAFGSWAALEAAKMRATRGFNASQPADIQQAIQEVEAILRDWPGTPAAEMARIWDIRWRFQRGEGEKIIGELFEVLRDQSPEGKRRAEALLDVVYYARDYSRRKVEQFRYRELAEADRRELESHRKQYLQLAALLHNVEERAVEYGTRFDDVKEYGKALLEAAESPNADEIAKAAKLSPEDARDLYGAAQRVWEEARKLDAQRIGKLRAEVEQRAQGWRERLAGDPDAAGMRTLAWTVVRAFEGKSPSGEPRLDEVDMLDGSPDGLQLLKAEGMPAEQMAFFLDQAIEDYARRARRNVVEDYDIGFGLARCYQKSGRYREAWELYAKLLPAEPVRRPEVATLENLQKYQSYWWLQVWYCECWLEVGAGAESLRSLARHIAAHAVPQLQPPAAQLQRLRDIRREAERRAAAAPSGD